MHNMCVRSGWASEVNTFIMSLLRYVEVCWQVLEGVGRCWKVLEGVGRCWFVAVREECLKRHGCGLRGRCGLPWQQHLASAQKAQNSIDMFILNSYCSSFIQ